MPTYSQLKGVHEIGNSLLSDQLESNLVEFFSWGLLGIGAFFNVNMPQSGAYGGSQHRLRVCDDPYYTRGMVWEGFRSNWVWESGVEYTYQPIAISGIYVNNVFYSTATTGTYTYQINYPLGRVVFSNAVSPSSVALSYSFKYINVYPANTEWFKEVMPNSFRVDDPEFNQYGSGLWNTLSQNRVQLPAIIVEPTPRRRYEAYEIGSDRHRIYQDVLFHVIAETSFERNNLSDIVGYQMEKTICLFDKNAMRDANMFPLNNGYLAPSALTYPNLVLNYRWRLGQFTGMSIDSYDDGVPGLYRSIVRATLAVDTPDY